MMCYAAALPLLIYGLLLAFEVIDRSDGNVAVLCIIESVAVFFTIKATVDKYRKRPRRERPVR